MTNRICIVDLDGVVADSSARFNRAEEAKQALLKDNDARFNALFGEPIDKQATALYWQTAFTPANVALDKRIEGVDDALLTLDELGYKVVFLTSRPEPMREATLEWLLINSVYGSQHSLIMKVSAFQYTKTTVWKAGMVQTLASLYGADDIVFVDDEMDNLQEAMKHKPIPLCFLSLAEAIEKL